MNETKYPVIKGVRYPGKVVPIDAFDLVPVLRTEMGGSGRGFLLEQLRAEDSHDLAPLFQRQGKGKGEVLRDWM